LGSMTGVRLELQAAAMLLATICDTLGRFKFDLFPGGLWDDTERCLYLPLPSWGRAAEFLDLSALSPLIEAMHNFGFVRTVKLVSLNAQGSPADDTICQHLAAQVSRLMHTLSFASTNAISWVSLEDIKGEPCATLA
jgi:hypothetical protein